MKGFWMNVGRRLLGRIRCGRLDVIFSDGTRMQYGEEEMPQATLVLHNHHLFRRTALFGDIGFAESYMDGDFETDDMTALITLALLNAEHLGTRDDAEKRFGFFNLLPHVNDLRHLLRRNSKSRSRKNISEHYDLSNDFFEMILDETMMYSSAVFGHPDEPLYDAQQRKIRRLADKMDLKPGDRVLEIGSGWGAMALHLARERGCEVTTVTLSKEQKALCEARFEAENVEAQVEVMLRDYRDLEGRFDAIIAVEMFEAVGREYFDLFFKKCESLLRPGGMLVMQVITMPDQRYASYCKGADFIQKYIFPGGHLPSLGKMMETTARHTRLNLQHMEEFTEDYARTLRIWHDNFNARLDDVRKLGFDDDFIRMWRLYLNYCEAAFLTRNVNLVQVAFTRDRNMALNKGLAA